MRIRLLAVSLLLLSLLCAACQQGENKTASGPRIAVVDVVRVMRDSEPGKAGIKFLEGIQADIQKQLDDIQAKLEKDRENQALQQQLQTVYMAAQQRMGAEQQNVLSQLQNVVQRTMDEFRKAQGYDVIMSAETMASFDAKLDVTNGVIEAMNSQKITFVPVGDKAAAPAAVPAPAAEESAAPAAAEPKADAAPAAAPASGADGTGDAK